MTNKIARLLLLRGPTALLPSSHCCFPLSSLLSLFNFLFVISHPPTCRRHIQPPRTSRTQSGLPAQLPSDEASVSEYLLVLLFDLICACRSTGGTGGTDVASSSLMPATWNCSCRDSLKRYCFSFPFFLKVTSADIRAFLAALCCFFLFFPKLSQWTVVYWPETQSPSVQLRIGLQSS